MKSKLLTVSLLKKPTFRELDYKRQQEQVHEAQEANETLLTNTKLTKWALWVTLGAFIAQVIEVLK